MESDTIQGLRTYAVLQNGYSRERAKAANNNPIMPPIRAPANTGTCPMPIEKF